MTLYFHPSGILPLALKSPLIHLSRIIGMKACSSWPGCPGAQKMEVPIFESWGSYWESWVDLMGTVGDPLACYHTYPDHWEKQFCPSTQDSSQTSTPRSHRGIWSVSPQTFRKFPRQASALLSGFVFHPPYVQFNQAHPHCFPSKEIPSSHFCSSLASTWNSLIFLTLIPPS